MTPLIRFGIAWLIGIILADKFAPPFIIILAFMGLAVIAYMLYRQVPHLALLIAVGGGALRLTIAHPTIDEQHIAFYNNSPKSVHLVGLVVDEPTARDNSLNLTLQVESLQFGDQTLIGLNGLVLVQAPRYPERFYGDRVQITGRLETPPMLDNFSYQDYLAIRGIYAMMRRPKIELMAHEQGYFFWTAMFTMKAKAAQTINRLLAEPHASLLNGILLGIKTGIPRALYESFKQTGTSHIIVISGSNMAIVIAIFLFGSQRLFERFQILGQQYASPLTMLAIPLYTFLVGADPSVSRAAVMGELWVLAMWIGRPGLALNSLVASAMLLTLVNPLTLWDIGFQLSFAATFGLILLVPPLERLCFSLLQRMFKTQELGLMIALLNELLIITLAAQLATAPLIIYHFSYLSMISFPANMLILPAQPFIMILGGLAILGGLVWLPVGQLLAWLVWLPLAWTVNMVEIFATWADMANFGTWPVPLIILIYATIAAGMWWADQANATPIPRFRLPNFGSRPTHLLLAVGLLALLGIYTLPDGKLHVIFLDVGQGDAILITTPSGQHILIDGGPAATQLNWQLGKHLPFWTRSLNLVVNTHPDADHLSGLVPLLDRYHIDQVLISDKRNESSLSRAWQDKLKQYQLEPIVAQANMQLDLGDGIKATILNPGPASTGQPNVNNHAVVMRLDMGQISFLLPGDIESPVEQNLVSSHAPLAATILKSPHHGSGTSSSEPFLKAVQPQVVIIQVGKDNQFGEPKPEVLARYAEHGATVFRTDQDGTIELITDGQTVTARRN